MVIQNIDLFKGEDMTDTRGESVLTENQKIQQRELKNLAKLEKEESTQAEQTQTESPKATEDAKNDAPAQAAPSGAQSSRRR